MHKPSDLQLSFGDGLIDPRLLQLDEELQQVDQLLENPELIRPFEACFDPLMGRPGTPIAVYLRMMYLKFRWGLSYEEVETEVRERLPWRFFCRLSLMDRVPDATTLIKLNQRFGEQLIGKLNKTLVKSLIKKKSIKGRTIRIDSTTITSHISYPTDIGLLHQTVTTLTHTARSLGEKITSHVRAAKKALARMGQSLKTKSANKKSRVHEMLLAIKALADDTITQSRAAWKKLRKRRSKQALQPFKEQITLAETIAHQTAQKLQGIQSIPDRIVSFHDPKARAIRKGKLNRPVEFGRTLLLAQDASGIIIDHTLYEGNPNDRPLLIPQVKRCKKLFGRPPKAAAADKGFYSEDNLEALKQLKVTRIGIPKIGRLTPLQAKKQKQPWFKTLQRFRCGIEACISMLKRIFSLGDVRVRGTPATAIWTGFSIFSYNLWQLSG